MTDARAAPPSAMPGAPRAAAVFIFNHKFEKNISKLEAMYEGRFDNRQYVMPFASTDDARTIRVFETGRNFSGHVAQAGGRLVRDPAITHYAFISDDLILNPRLGQDDLVDALGLGPRTGFIKSITSSDSLRYSWPWSGEVATSLYKFGRSFDWRSELPPAADAQSKFKAMGVSFPFPAPRSAKEMWFGTLGLARKSSWAFGMGLLSTGRRAQYPLLAGYSDFFVVPAPALDAFVGYCGVFAALGVFAEVAIPTSLALAVDELRTEMPVGAYFMEAVPPAPDAPGFQGREFWVPGEPEAFAAGFSNERARLEREFPANWLYVHPVKLSQWR